MAWRSSLALVRQVWALRGRVLLGKVLFYWHEVGRGFDHETNVGSFTAERACKCGAGNGLEVFSSTCQTVLASWMTGTPRKTDSEKSSSLGMKSAKVSTMKPMLGASLPREPVRIELAMV